MRIKVFTRVDSEVVAKLKLLAMLDGTCFSDIVRNALSEYLKKRLANEK